MRKGKEKQDYLCDMEKKQYDFSHNKALLVTAIPLRSIAAGELDRSMAQIDIDIMPGK